MEKVRGNETDRPGLAAEPIEVEYSLEASTSCGLNSGVYFDESLQRGFPSSDLSSSFYYGLNYASGGFGSSASGQTADVANRGNMSMMPPVSGAVDQFSVAGPSNAPYDYTWDFGISKQFPDLDYQFPQEPASWNPSLVSQSSGSSGKAAGVSELSRQIPHCQNNQPKGLIKHDVNGNYMTSSIWDMLMNDGAGLNSSYSLGPKYISGGGVVDTSASYHCINNEYVGTSHDNNLIMGSCTSSSAQCCNASPLNEGTQVINPCLQGYSVDKQPAYSCGLQEFTEASPMDTSESYYCSNEGYFGNTHELNLLGAPYTSSSVQFSDASLVDGNIKVDDSSLLSVLINKPAKFCDPQNVSEASPVDEHAEADHYTLQGVSVNKHVYSTDLRGMSQVNSVASPMEAKDSNGSNEGYFGTAHDLNLLGMSFNSMFMEFSDPSLADEDTEADDPLLQGLSIGTPVDLCDPQEIGEPNNVASPGDTGESHQHSSEGNAATSNNFDFHPQGLAGNSICVQVTDASPSVEEAEDDPTLQSILTNKRAKCKKVGPQRQKRVKKPIQRCNNDASTSKTRFRRKRKEEPVNCSERQHAEGKPQIKRPRKRTKDAALVAEDAVTRESSKEDLDSDVEYVPYNSNISARGSKKAASDGRKSNKLWSLSEVTKLVDGVCQYGVGKWTAIQRSFSGSTPYRTSLDIRDKWRNLIRTSAMRLEHMKEEEFSAKFGSIPLPKSLLEKICELDREQPYLRSVVKRPRNWGDDLDLSSE